MIGVPVGPGHEDVEEHVRDLLQLVRINSFPDTFKSPARTRSWWRRRTEVFLQPLQTPICYFEVEFGSYNRSVLPVL